MTSSRVRPLWAGFIEAAARFPDRPALSVQGQSITYRELGDSAQRIAATIESQIGHRGNALTAVLASRSPTAFAGVLGSLLAGNGYVPLNPAFPHQRNLEILARSGCTSVLVDGTALSQLPFIIDGASEGAVVILPDESDVTGLQARWPRYTFVGAPTLVKAAEWKRPSSSGDAIAYLLFTSGSTGKPKGVAVAQRNVRAFLDYMVESYAVTERDRFSQMFDFTFDLSVFDMFVAWERGACVCCPSQKQVVKPDRFLIDNELTIWFSTPSAAAFMKQLGALRPKRFATLRLSLFCGEPLPASLAQSWSAAAPNSVLENLYGPTELTIACARYHWDAARSPGEAELGIVAIGNPYPGMAALVVDDQLREVPPGAEGELLMNGPQMTPGYWNDPENNRRAYVIPPGTDDTYYRTGDRVRRPVDGGPMTHLGRIDFQIKVLGHRVELGEIEEIVRQASGLDGVIAVGWPPNESGYGGIEVFIEGSEQSGKLLREIAAERLPPYMTPRRFHFRDRLPRNSNNKFDRKALTEVLRAGL
jgi:amino acid adenylation domain-containing protein